MGHLSSRCRLQRSGGFVFLEHLVGPIPMVDIEVYDERLGGQSWKLCIQKCPASRICNAGPRCLAMAAASPTLPKRQKPRAASLSAWWPRARTWLSLTHEVKRQSYEDVP